MRWYQKIERLKRHRGQNVDETMDQTELIKRNEVGIIHPVNQAGIVIRDNGTIQCFSDFGLGFQIDQKQKTMSLYGAKIMLFCEEFKVMEKWQAEPDDEDEWNEILRMRGGEET